jgi:hypothetical protein
VVIASSTRITITGSITAMGGNGGFYCDTISAGVGSGGAIRLVAPQLAGTGSLLARGGYPGHGFTLGRIKLEAFTFTFSGSTTPLAFMSLTPGPVTASSNPALINLPTLTISSIGGIAVPGTPRGSYVTADVSLPQGTPNSVNVTLNAANIPLSTVFTVKLTPQGVPPTTISSTPSTGSFPASTGIAVVSFPPGQVSVLTAFKSFILPTTVSTLFPMIDGEPIGRILVAANSDEPSSLTLITKSGKEIPVNQLSAVDQLLISKGWEAISNAKE